MQRFAKFVEHHSDLDSYVAQTVTYESYCDMIDGVVPLYESNTSDKAKQMGLTYFGFGRWGKDDTVKYISQNDKLVPQAEAPAVSTAASSAPIEKSSVEDEKIKLSNISKKLSAHISSIASDLKVPRESVADAFKQKPAYEFLKSVGFNLKKAGSAALKGLSTLRVGFKATFEEMHKSGMLKKIASGAAKADEVLNKYPALKKIGGLAIAGFLVYQWQHMAFSGDLEDDYNVSNIPKALTGDYSIEDLFASPKGLLGLAQLGVGIATGLTFPWGAIGASSIKLAVLYTGARAIKNSSLADKVKTAANL